MKELTTDEKAKRYEEIINSAKIFYSWAVSKGDTDQIQDYKILFPEIKDFENRNMWNLIQKYAHSNISDTVLESDHITREYLESWLKKQDDNNLIEEIKHKKEFLLHEKEKAGSVEELVALGNKLSIIEELVEFIVRRQHEIDYPPIDVKAIKVKQINFYDK